MTEQKRKVGRPAGKEKHIHTITLDKGLLEQIKQHQPEFKLSTFVNDRLIQELVEIKQHLSGIIRN
jgi:hypothetical protein